MNDWEDPKNKDGDGLEKHIKMTWEETPSQGTKTPEPPSRPSFESGPVKTFYQDVIQILTEPVLFFKSRYPKMKLSHAIAFGIVINWIASLLDWITRAIHHETLLDGLLKMRDKLQQLPFWKSLPDNFWAQSTDTGSSSLFPAWIAEMLSIALSPFQSLIHFAFSGMLYFLGAYFLISRKPKETGQDPVILSEFIKLACVCAAPALVTSILGFLPIGLGSLIGWFYSIALLIIGMTTRFQISGLRAVVVLIIPGVASAVVVMATVGIFIALFIGMLAALFH